MRYLIDLSIYLPLTTLLCCCSDKSPAPQIINEAPDYSPLAEALKFIGLCLLGISVVYAAAILLNNLINKHDD